MLLRILDLDFVTFLTLRDNSRKVMFKSHLFLAGRYCYGGLSYFIFATYTNESGLIHAICLVW